MAVAFNGQATNTTGGGTTVSFSYTSGSGSDRYLLVGCAQFAGLDITAVSYNSVALTNIYDAGVGTAPIELWGLVAPATGSNTLSFTMSSYDPGGVKYSTTDWTGVDQTTPVGAAVVATGSSAAPATGSITVPAGGAAFGIGRHQYTAAMTINQGTLTGSLSTGGVGLAGAYRATTGDLSWTASNNFISWRAVGVPINAAGSGGGSTLLAKLNHFMRG